MVGGSVNFSPVRSMDSFLVYDAKSEFDGWGDGKSVLPRSGSMCGSPRKSVEVEVYRNVISFTILSEVAKIDRSVWFVVCVPTCVL